MLQLDGFAQEEAGPRASDFHHGRQCRTVGVLHILGEDWRHTGRALQVLWRRNLEYPQSLVAAADYVLPLPCVRMPRGYLEAQLRARRVRALIYGRISV
jgi:hypothetical protein